MPTLSEVLKLDKQDSELVHRCVRAIADGQFLPDWEFRLLTGADRDEIRSVADNWPSVSADKVSFMIVNNCLVNLLGYPHGMYDDIPALIATSIEGIEEVLRRVRDSAKDSFLAGRNEETSDSLS